MWGRVVFVESQGPHHPQTFETLPTPVRIAATNFHLMIKLDDMNFKQSNMSYPGEFVRFRSNDM